MKILLVRGPGSHFQLIYNLFLEKNICFEYIEYSPKFVKKKVVNGKVIETKYSLFFSFVDRVFALLFLRILNSKILYDRSILSFYSYWLKYFFVDADTIIACSQVALPLFKKYKGKKNLVLEYPMIHPNEQLKLVKNHIKINDINKSNYLNNKDRKIISFEIELADSINVVSNYAKESFIKNEVIETKINVIPLFADPITFKIVNNLNKFEKFTLLFVGRIEFQKGIYKLIEYLKNCSIEIELILIGPINDISLIEKINNISFIKYLGIKNKNELVEYYNSSHILVLPSVQESFGIVLLESLMCGTPIIASHNTGINDILIDENLGFKFDLESQDDFLNKIEYVYKNFQKYGDKIFNREIVKKKFNKSHFENQYLKSLKIER